VAFWALGSGANWALEAFCGKRGGSVLEFDSGERLRHSMLPPYLLFPSSYEPFGLVVAEAAAGGCCLGSSESGRWSYGRARELAQAVQFGAMPIGSKRQKVILEKATREKFARGGKLLPELGIRLP